MSIYVVNIIRRGRENGTSIKSKELNDNVLSTLSIRSLSWKKCITFIILKTDLDLGKKKKKKTYNGSSAPTSDGPPNTWSRYSEHFSLRKSVNYVFSNPSGISGLEETWNKLYRAIFCLENAAPLLL